MARPPSKLANPPPPVQDTGGISAPYKLSRLQYSNGDLFLVACIGFAIGAVFGVCV